jgi:uncharacterized integral membrane protein (TIGR00697 family)
VLILVGLYVACELVANLTAVKPVVLGPLVVPAGVFIYAVTFTLLDLINERLGRSGARQVVVAGIGANLLLAGYAWLTVTWPAPAFFDGQPAVARVLGAAPRIVLASLLAYGVSGLLDAEIFAWWRARLGGPAWVRVLASNAVSTLVDSALFVTIAFVGILPVVPLVVGQYLTKMGVTLVSLPLIYLVRHRAGHGRSPLGAAVAALALLAFGLAGPAAAAPQASPPRIDPGRAPAVATAATRAEAAVVGLRARIPAGRPSTQTLGTERWGAGVLIEPDGLVVTVGYLVLEARALEAVLADGRVVPGRVVGHDFESGLALVRLEGPGPFPVAPLGRGAELQPGQPVTIVGAADGDGPPGRVARAARVEAVRPFVAYWEYRLDRALVLSPHHPAFGGAAVLDPEGKLVGLVSLRLEKTHLAIPIDLLPPVRDDLVTTGRPGRPPRAWLGIRAVALDGGIGVAGVSSVGPAHAAGLREGDVIVRVGGTTVSDLETFYQRVWATTIGQPLELTVARDGGLSVITVRPADRYRLFDVRSP